ncbi:MAG TPA: hypothetical protein VIP11_13445 [Gemmatimonadaceae bacterium]
MNILTGDDDAVACNVCARTGVDASHAALGADVDRASDPARSYQFVTR